MKKILKIVWIFIVSIIVFLIIVFTLVWVNTAWIDEKANEVINKIQAWNIEALYTEIQKIEKETKIENWLTLKELTNAIILPSGQADLRTIKNVVWTWRWFENNMKYIQWEWDLDNGLRIELKLEFLEKDWKYLFYGIFWKQIK
jgi:hypothetical protein